MKKKYLFLVVLFLSVLMVLTGCSSGTNEVSEDIANSQSGNVVVSIKRPSVESASADGDVKAQSILPESTNVRLRIFNDLRNITNDIVIPDTGVNTEEIKLPVGTYTIEAIAYGDSNVVHTIGKATGINVESGTSTSVNITLERPTYSMNAYTYDESNNKVNITELEAGNEFNIDFSIDLNGFTRNTSYTHFYTYKEGDPFPENTLDNNKTSGSTVVLSTPLVEKDTTFNVYAMLYFESDVYGDSFRVYFPDPEYLGKTPYQITLTPPEGGINIGIE